MADNSAVLDVSGLRTDYATQRGVVTAVKDVAFTVGREELVGLVGESGCGKSATIRSILGMLSPAGRVVSGSADFGGTDLLAQSRSELRRIRGRHIGYIPQNPIGSLNPILRIEQQFLNVLRAHSSMSKGEARRRAIRMLEDVAIGDPERVLRGYAHELSGGMAQRVVIAMALIMHPRLVVADEPTTGLDLTTERQVLDLSRRLINDNGSSMLLITHELAVVAQYCHRVLVMYQGEIVESGPVASVFGNPRHPYTTVLLDGLAQAKSAVQPEQDASHSRVPNNAAGGVAPPHEIAEGHWVRSIGDA